MQYILLFLLSVTAFAQSPEQPQKENIEDLRSSFQVFKIEDLKTGKTFEMARTLSMENYLRMIEGKSEELRKVDSRAAKKLDMDFAAKFIRIQYEIPAVEGDCEVTLRLTMKGEQQDICKKDEKKSQEVASFVEELAKRF